MRIFPKRHKIAIVELFGSIGGNVKSAVYEKIFSKIEEGEHFSALVLDIDSPGGAVPASDYLYRSVAKVALKKPVVASIRGIGASGAYMVCCAAQRIIATPGALVGSIGVISIRPELEVLLKKFGAKVKVNKSGEFKDMGAFWRSATQEEEGKMQGLVDSAHASFLSLVARARNMDEGKVREIATGEVFWAPKATELGLVDELGDLSRAIDIAAELSGSPRRPVKLTPRRGFRERLTGQFADSLVQATTDEIERRIWSSYMI